MRWSSPIPAGTRRQLRTIVKILFGAGAVLGILISLAGLALLGFQMKVASDGERSSQRILANQLEAIYRPVKSRQDPSVPPETHPASVTTSAPPDLTAIQTALRTGDLDRETTRALDLLVEERLEYVELLAEVEASGGIPPEGAEPAEAPGGAYKNSVKGEALRRNLELLRDLERSALDGDLEGCLTQITENEGRLPAEAVIEWAGLPVLPETIWFPGEIKSQEALIEYARLRDPSLGFRNLAASIWILIAYLGWIAALAVALRRAGAIAPYLRATMPFVLGGLGLGAIYLIGGILEGSSNAIGVMAQGLELVTLNPPTHLVFGAIGIWTLVLVRRREAAAAAPEEGDSEQETPEQESPVEACRSVVAPPGWFRAGFLAGLAATLWTCFLFLTVEWGEGSTMAAQSALRKAFEMPDPSTLVMCSFVFGAALWEELQYRAFLVGVTMALIPGRLGKVIAYVLPAIIWTCLHIGMITPEWLKFAQLFPLGLAFTWLLRRHGLAASVLAHVVLNAFAVTLPFFR